MNLATMSATEAAAAIRGGRIASEELVRASLARIGERESQVKAWTFLDPELALAQARAADRARRDGRPLGALHGVPVGIKDIFDTADMPTENGSVLHAGRRPERDSTVVRRLREAGAVILGKTVTTEFAAYTPAATRNPRDLSRTPGGSSSGSAAAVADGMVPAALGSQTNGSVIRPAAFCGVVGYKPSYGLVSRAGALALSRSLDQVGLFVRTVEDAALVAECLAGFDPADPDTLPGPPPEGSGPQGGPRPELARAGRPAESPPRLAFVRTPVWESAEDDTRRAFAGLVAALGPAVEEAALPPEFDGAVAAHLDIMDVDLAHNLRREYDTGRGRLSARLRQEIERGQQILAVDYARALDLAPRLNALLEPLFGRYDALLAPSAPGVAPEGLGATGNPIFCTIWTFCGTPAITLPILEGRAGLPIGAQLIGRRGDDGRLLGVAGWLMERFAGAPVRAA
ncbi:MAG: amidase [Alphaproteobacteria bacterium]